MTCQIALVEEADRQLREIHEATPEEFRKKASVRISRDRTWSAPALADGVLYIRTWKELIAVRVGATP